MIEQFDYWPAAQVVLDELAAHSNGAPALDAISRTLARIAAAPYDRKLGTTVFQTEAYGGISATPTRYDNWYIFGQRGPEPTILDIVLIEQLDVGREH